MRVLITGGSNGIGLAAVQKFLAFGHEVWSLDILPCPIEHPSLHDIRADVSKPDTLPAIAGIQILVNNAGVQDSGRDIEVNLLGTMHCTEQYGIQPDIRAIVNLASASAHTGAEFPAYSASKGGILAYTKNTALRIAQYGATCNSLSPGGVCTAINQHIMDDSHLWSLVMDETLLRKWASAQEISEWIYFVAVINQSMTAQDILIDNGEQAKSNFIW